MKTASGSVNFFSAKVVTIASTESKKKPPLNC